MSVPLRALRGAAAAAAAALCAGCAPMSLFAPPSPLPETSLTLIGGQGAVTEAPPATFDELDLPAPPEQPPMSLLRAQAVREAAMAWGAQNGRARRSWEIAETYTARSAELDAVWDFRRAALPAPMQAGWLLPPVVQRAGAVWSGGGQSAEAAVAYYEIMRPGRVAGRLPGWRDYLPPPGETPDPPARSLLPEPGEERQWREWAAEGWLAGVEMAEQELDEGLARLERDYTGMIEFRRLLAQGMLSDMVVEAAHWPALTAEEGTQLRIGGRRVTIKQDAEFIGDSGRWRPRVVTARGGAPERHQL